MIYCGPLEDKKIEEMTRDELIEAVRELVTELNSYRTPEMCRAISLGKVMALLK